MCNFNGVTSKIFRYPVDRKILNILNKDQSHKHLCNTYVTYDCLYEFQLSTFYVHQNMIASITKTNLKNIFPA